MSQAPAVIERPRFLERPEALEVMDLVEQHNRILAALADETVMKRGLHYGNPINERTGKHVWPKPSLLKPGAHKLCKMFHLRPRYEELGVLHREKLIAYRYRCVLIHFPTGFEIGEGVGSCNSREKKYVRDDPWDIDNTIEKMAAKRALVEAVLVSTAASDIFQTDGDKTPTDWHRTLNAKAADYDKTAPRADGESWIDWTRTRAGLEWEVQSRSELDADQLQELVQMLDEEAAR